MTAADELTPLFKQYWEIKNQYPDVLLLFRLGDFYEMFGADAETASPILQITLTARERGGGERIPMCGVPHHAAERYVARLVAAGHRVALCEQIEDARFAKGIVRRKVTRMLTPGILLDDSMLQASSNNYLVSLELRGQGGLNAVGLSACDVSTGEFAVTEFEGPSAARCLAEELARLQPREMIVPDEQRDLLLTAGLRSGGDWVLADPAARRSYQKAHRETLLEHFRVHNLAGFGCDDLVLAQAAGARLLEYLRSREVDVASLLRALYTYSPDCALGLDGAARRNLELVKSAVEGERGRSLLSILDLTCTALGGRLLRRWIENPMVDLASIEQRLDQVEELCDAALLRSDLREKLKPVADLERLASRCAAGRANPRDLGAVRDSLRLLPEVIQLVEQGPPRLAVLAARADLLDDLLDLLDRGLVDEPPTSTRDGGIIREGYETHLDETRQRSRSGKVWIADLETSEREKTGIKSLKVGFNNVFGYYIEVTKPNLAQVPPSYIRKQTVANAERFFTPELKEQEALVLGADERIQEIEARLFGELRDKVGQQIGRLLSVAQLIATLDALCSLAEAAVRNDYVRPVIDAGGVIDIRGGRHPVVERLSSEPFVPNDTLLDLEDNRVLIITGPNMAGKSTYLRQVALIVLMAQAGSFVPASSAVIGVVDRIFTRVGAHDDLSAGQSTFMVEMTETAGILHHATSRSLVILDEVGRGTSTYDGLAIAWAVAEELHATGARTLFATHYHHLNELPKRLPGVKNFRAAVREEGDQVVWLRRIVPGGADRSYGIHVARLAGLPESVIDRAGDVLRELEAQSERGRQAPPKAAVIPARKQKVQLALFEAEEHPVIERLRGLDVGGITPMQALTLLQRLQEETHRK